MSVSVEPGLPDDSGGSTCTGGAEDAPQDEFSALRGELTQCREQLAALHESLYATGLLKPQTVRHHLLMVRKAVERRQSLDAVFSSEDIALAIGRCVGLSGMAAARMTCEVLRKTATGIWSTLREDCPPHVYICGGRADGGQILDSVERFTPHTRSDDESTCWDTTLPKMLEKRVGAGCGVVQGRLYVCGGWSGDGHTFSSAECYHPATSSWQALPSMLVAREAMAAGVIDGKLYVCGGFNSDRQALSLAERFDPVSHVWEALPSMLGRRGGAASAALGPALYVCGGRDREGPLSSAERFNADLNSWEALPEMSVPRVAAAAAALLGNICVVGGWSNGWQAQHSTEILDPLRHAWTLGQPMLAARSGAAAASVRGRIIVFGGHNGSCYLETVEQFDPAAEEWTSLPPLPEQRLFVTAAAACP
eukprot:TRINITY_DN54775_c0_g1_i1.p1 TRINITY_DN54775_c0_g1~~TRINITY_DN54775_c0_g1_i1.p1  ORF type:complete len:422 (-),score=81.69 TRINITY_DN54775_c0_g1_i1:67-1332(-)